MSPVAWTHTSGESCKYEKLTSAIAKRICIERHVATEILKVKVEFQMRRDEEDQKNKEVAAVLMCQSAFRMRQGRKAAMVIFQKHWITLIDCSSGCQMWYNLRERRSSWNSPYMLHRGQVVVRFSTFNARGPDDNGLFWYEERPSPYRPKNEPKASSWTAPKGIMLCQRCDVAIVRRRCCGEGCVNDRSCLLYLCFFCYDAVHPTEDTGDQDTDAHRNHKHEDYPCPSIETFLCSICASTSATKYCRDGECKGVLYCSTCYQGVHSHAHDAWHVSDDIKPFS